MKRIIHIILMSSCSVIAACSGPILEKSKITGTYVRTAEFKSGKLLDTIIITMINGSTAKYDVARHTLDSPKGTRKEVGYTGDYDESSQTMTLNDPSKVYYFDLNKHQLKTGNNLYRLVR